MITLTALWFSAKYKYDFGFIFIGTTLLDMFIFKSLLIVYFNGCL